MKVDLTAAASEAGPANQQSPVQIFISYRRDDAAPDAGRLNEALSDFFGSEQVFTDVDDILPGRFGGDIRAAIDGSVALIALIGPRWVNASGSNGRRLDAPDDYVRVEIRHAITQGKALFPVLVHGTRMPRHDELPGDIASLTSYSALDLTDSHWRADVVKLIDALVRVGAPVPPLTAFPGEHPHRGRAERRDAWLGVGRPESSPRMDRGVLAGPPDGAGGVGVGHPAASRRKQVVEDPGRLLRVRV